MLRRRLALSSLDNEIANVEHVTAGELEASVRREQQATEELEQGGVE